MCSYKGKPKEQTFNYSSLPKSTANSFAGATRPRTSANPIWGHFGPPPLEIINYSLAVQIPMWGTSEPPLPRCLSFKSGANSI